MTKSFFPLFIVTVLSLSVFGQSKQDQTLFTIAGEKVSVGEFEYVYNKNNVNNTANHSDSSMRNYLELYKNFRLKVREAEAMRLDTVPSLVTELEGYRKQLAKSYLTDKEITDQLIKEAYDRSLMEVNASHILVKCDENANPADTFAAYKKVLELRKRLQKGEDFGKVARENSDDPSAKQNDGNIGFFTVFQVVYPFETAAYNTKKGEFSMPVRTQFGYHVVKVLDTRPAQGEVRAAHLLLKFSEKATDVQKDSIGKRIDSIYKAITSGSLSFEDAVAQFSDDRTTKSKKGELPFFGVGKMVPEFEAAAFGLKKDGELSKPVKTAYGWHIIKRLEKKDKIEFNDAKNDMKRKVERDSRSQVAKSTLIARLKKDYNFTEVPTAKPDFFFKVDSSILKGTWKAEDKSKLTKNMFSFAGKNHTEADFADFIEKTAKHRSDKGKEALLNEYYENFVNQKLLDYEESQLETKKPEFKNLMKEYRDGILLFELSDRMVWSKAVKDTAGLEKFHEQQKNKYMWANRADAVIFNSNSEKLCNEAHKMTEKGKSGDEIKKKLNKEGAKDQVSFFENKYEKGQYDLVDKTGWKIGITPVTKNNDSSFTFINIKQIVSPEPKTLKEAKGYVVSDYQEYLEKTWMADLKNRYPIVVNQDIFQSLIKK